MAAVYVSATQSLAALEVLVHVDTDLVPDDFVVFAVDIPEVVAISILSPGRLPRDWRHTYPHDALQEIGREWLQQCATAVLRVPSALIEGE